MYDLQIEVRLKPGATFVCKHELGQTFHAVGEDLIFDGPSRFSIYALAALLPVLTGMQRAKDANDWMTADTDVACPDANCGAVFRITRTGQSTFGELDPAENRHDC